jgi:hypothetical protein
MLGGFMRMRFEAGAEDEFEAACGLLVDRLVRWAGEEGLPVDGFLAEAALEYRHRATADGRLGLWEPRHVDELLLHWLPQKVTELPGEECGDAPGTLRTLLRYLHAAQLADPRGPALEDSLAAVDTAAEQYSAAMADRSRWGLAKFWMTTAAEQGVDVLDEAALQRFAERAQREEVAYDEDALDAIMERRLTGRLLSDAARSEPQLPVTLSPDGELRRQAEASVIVAQLRGLAEWAGRDGRTVTAAGRLRMADARELVDVLGTRDKVEGVRSSADLPRLGLLEGGDGAFVEGDGDGAYGAFAGSGVGGGGHEDTLIKLLLLGGSSGSRYAGSGLVNACRLCRSSSRTGGLCVLFQIRASNAGVSMSSMVRAVSRSR